jgi:hypothetical protein
LRLERNKSKGGSQESNNDEEESQFENNPEEGHIVSKENIFVREILQEMGQKYEEEHFL